MTLSKEQAEAILWLSGAENAGAWQFIEQIIDKSLASARNELETSSDQQRLYQMQGEIRAYKRLADLRKSAESMLTTRHS